MYTKKTGNKPDFANPVVLTSDRGGTTVEALCRQIHKSLVTEFKCGLNSGFHGARWAVVNAQMI